MDALTDNLTQTQARAPISIGEIEQWRPVPDYENYEISNFGRIRRMSLHPCHPECDIKKLKKEKNGYIRVGLTKNGKQRLFSVNRLVALVFLGEPPSEMHQAAHGDGNRQNNHWRNLRWATQSENESDKIQHGTSSRCEGNGRAKLTEKQVFEIRKIYSEGVISQKELGSKFGIGAHAVSEIVRYIKWAHLEAI